MTSENIYKVIELVGTSPEGVEKPLRMLSAVPAKPYKVWIGLKLRRFEATSKKVR